MKKFTAGQYLNQSYYKSFQPEPIHREWLIDDMEVLNLLSRADRQIGRLDMYSEYVNIDFFISLHIAKEATQSSKIEGTQINMEEAFLEKDEIAGEKRSDWEEVQNYIQAMNEAILQLHELPFSSRLIRNIHQILLQGVRGEHKQPGEFRQSQNWIGGASINDAVFIPPAHTSVPELMSDIEKFAHDEMLSIPDLLKIAIIHYQFETIHPFLDGNGRVGRLMITLYLVSKGILKRPILYLSDFFERNRILYYDNLMRVRTHHDVKQWLKFFLTGIIETAQHGVKTFDAILQLQKDIEQRLQALGSRTHNAQAVVKALYQRPVTDVNKVVKETGLSNPSAYKLLNDLEGLKILKEITGGKRGKLYVFSEYLDIFK